MADVFSAPDIIKNITSKLFVKKCTFIFLGLLDFFLIWKKFIYNRQNIKNNFVKICRIYKT